MRAECTASSWWRNRSPSASDAPRSRAISAAGKARVGSGRRARLPDRPDGPGWNATCTSGCSAIALSTPAVARLNSSVRALSCLLPLIFHPWGVSLRSGKVSLRSGAVRSPPTSRGGGDLTAPDLFMLPSPLCFPHHLRFPHGLRSVTAYAHPFNGLSLPGREPAVRDLLIEAALVVFRHRGPLRL